MPASDRFATVEELEARFRPLSADERTRAEALLDDATAALRIEFANAGKEICEDDEELAGTLRMVACSMVKRVLANGAMADISQMSESRGPFSSSVTYANPSGDMYIREDERRWLGIPKRTSRIGFVGPSCS